MMYLLWIIYFIPHLLVTFICWWTNPIACLFVKTTLQTDVIRRLNNHVVTMSRDDLYKPFFYLWQTNDHQADWGWYGAYDIPFMRGKTQKDYDNSAWLRYCCRVWWLNRNTAYGWSYLLFSLPKGEGFQFKGQTKPIFGYYNDFNCGWKSQTGFPRDNYAARIIGLRKVKK